MPVTAETGSGVEYERRFALFGSHLRLLIGDPAAEALPSHEAIGLQVEGFLRMMHRRLTRFEPDSELSLLNASTEESIETSSILAAAVEAAVWAANRSGGLIDPTLIGELESAGYASSRAGLEPAPIEEALVAAPTRRPARPRHDSRWPEISVDRALGFVTRPPGVGLDLGGSAKGLAADLVSERLAGYATHVVDAGGDLRIGGEHPQSRQVRIEHPFGDGLAHSFQLAEGAVATSGIRTRLWRTDDGFAHHLLDPSTGEPAWTGVIQATALGSSALEAETLAKMAFLSGPEAGIDLLSERGGLLVLDDGTVRPAGALAAEEVAA
jgi:thiamine biosynthesis lipoprotein